MPVDAPTQRVIDAYRRSSERLRQHIIRYLTLAWGNLDDYRTADIERWVAQIVPVVEGSLRQMASMTDAYLAAVETVTTGERAAPIGAETPTTETLRGVPASEVYQRAGVTVWTALSTGIEFPDAWQQGIDRATSIATTDLQLAKTHTSRSILARKTNVSGYRRVLEGARSCGLCVVASTQRYRKGDLMPIHGGCDCGVLPIYGTDDPGQVINPDTLDGIHERIADRFGGIDEGARGRDGIPDYRDVLVTHNHGEIGPVLSRKGDAFTSPRDL